MTECTGENWDLTKNNHNYGNFSMPKKNLWNDSDSTSRSAHCDLAKKMCDQEILFWFFNACHCFCEITKCSYRWCYKFPAFNMGLLLKVQTFWEAHKNLRNLPHALYIYLVNVQTMRKIFFKFCVLLRKSELYCIYASS